MCLWVNLRHDSRRDKSGDQFRVILWSSNLKNKGKIRRVGPAKGGKCLVSSKRKPFKSSSTNLNGLIILLAWIVFVLSGTRHYTCVCVFARHTLSGISSWFAKVKIERKFQQYNMSLIECTFVDAKLAPSLKINLLYICIEVVWHYCSKMKIMQKMQWALSFNHLPVTAITWSDSLDYVVEFFNFSIKCCCSDAQFLCNLIKRYCGILFNHRNNIHLTCC